MQPSDKTILPWLALALLTAGTAFAMEGAPIAASYAGEPPGVTCHLLMTEKECADFRTTLTTLPVGAARSAFLAQHFALMREREAACSYRHYKADADYRLPRARQVVHQF